MKRWMKGFEYLPLAIILIIAYKLLNHFEIVRNAYHFIVGIMIPFLWAFTFAYLLNPLVRWIQKKTALNRPLSVLVSYGITGVILTVVVMFVFPEISNSAIDIIKNMPKYISGTEKLVDHYTQLYPDLISTTDLQEALNRRTEELTQMGASLISSFLLSIISFANHLLKVLIGIIISIYFLLDKEKFAMGIKKIIYGLLDEQVANHIVEFGVDVDSMFSKFIVGKTIDSLIIGILAYFGMLLIQAPYPVLFAFIIGITNMIPFFGPFIGGVPVAIITFFFDPITGLWSALFILVLQQFDGYILGPKILGDSVGLSAFWIILSILVGGALFGVIGMLIAVPTTAVLRNRTLKYLDRSLENKGIKL